MANAATNNINILNINLSFDLYFKSNDKVISIADITFTISTILFDTLKSVENCNNLIIVIKNIPI